MPPRLNQISVDHALAERLAGFEAMQAFDQDEARAVGPHQDRRLQAGLQDADGERLDLRRVERLPSRLRHIDVGDGEGLTFHRVAIIGYREGAAENKYWP